MEKAMEGLRKLEEKWKISTAEALLLFVCTAIAVVGLCATATAVLRKKRARRTEQRTAGEEVSIDGFGSRSESGTGLGTVKQLLIGSVRGSEATKWAETESVSSQPMQPTLLGSGRGESQWSGQSSPLSPLWQRRILMGEKCEMPRYSGLILYDERGRPLHSDKENCQKKAAPVVNTTLKDLL